MKFAIASLIFFFVFIVGIEAQSWDERPAISLETQYEQDFTSDTWDGAVFYNQWQTVLDAEFSADDIASGYLRLYWNARRIVISKEKLNSPYIIETDIQIGERDAETYYNLGAGVVIRADIDGGSENPQEPLPGEAFNRTGIAFYPKNSDFNTMIVQFTNDDFSNQARIEVPKPATLGSLKDKYNLRIEDYETSVYVFINDAPFVRIDLGDKIGVSYTSGIVYDANMVEMGTFTGMKVDARGKVAFAVRDAGFNIYNVKINYNELEKQSINFDPINAKLMDDAPFALSATATSGLPVEFRVEMGPASIDGNNISLNGAGLVRVIAYQSGNNVFLPAEEVIQTFIVNESSLPIITEQNKAYGDQWVATDGADRILPSYDDCGDYRSDRFVGVFYWLWHANLRIRDLTTVPDLLRENPVSPAFEFRDYYWGEMENGFYHPSDPWVLRRNLQMLANAGVDFVYVDFTNGDQGCNSLDDFMSVALDMKSKGISVPKLAFFMNENYQMAMPCVVEKIYSNPEYRSMLFMWEGKPLLMADLEKCATQCDMCLDPAIIDFFTWRRTWAFDAGQWNFIDSYPQDYFIKDEVVEQMPVSKSAGAPLWSPQTSGSSYSHNGPTPVYNEYWETELTPFGYYFEEQWQRAHEVDPQILCITGWNELTAGAWTTDGVPFMGKPSTSPDWRCVSPETCGHRNPDGTHKSPHGWHMVDEFNTEFNRDIEPMKGGYTDNYYYQLVSHIRQYKGMAAPEAVSEEKTIAIDGSFEEWTDVTPEYKDAPGDVINRNFKNVIGTEMYINNTARNDIVASKLTYDEDNVYFYVRTVDDITSYTDPNWMLLFIDADRNKATGWEGYEWMINKFPLSSSQTSLQKFAGNDWNESSSVSYIITGNEMEIAIPRLLLNMEQTNPEFYFHWADNPQHLDDITAFFTDGESAPDRRFNYNFSTTAINIGVQSDFKEQTIPGIIEFEDFDNGGAGISYSDSDFGNNGETYRVEESVDIKEKAKDEYYVTDLYSKEWLEYTVNINAIGIFTATIYYAANDDNQSISLLLNNQNVSTLSLIKTGTEDQWSSIQVDVKLNSGNQIFKVFADNVTGDLQIDKIVFTEKDVVYPGNGNGLYRTLYNGDLGGRNWFTDSICSEIDPIISHEWKGESPGCGTRSTFWNARWEGMLQALYTEEYTISITMNDLARVWIDNQLLIDAWAATDANKTYSAKINLSADEKLPIKIDYANKIDEGNIKLEWESASQLKEIIPKSQLYSEIKTKLSNNKPDSKIPIIYPNPAINKVRIELLPFSKIEMFNSRGQRIYTNEISSDFIEIDVHNWNSGIYLVSIQSANKVYNQKLIIE